jgi:hypothetical protein
MEVQTYNLHCKMEVQTYNLLTIIKGSIQWIVSRNPRFYHYEDNYVALFWNIEPDQDSVYDMFNSKNDMEFYSKHIKQSFEKEYPNLILNVKYTFGPIEIDNSMYSRIIFYYNDSSYQNTNIFFVS